VVATPTQDFHPALAPAGEFFHAYTRSFDGRFFFEFVERRGYDGFGAVNAAVRLAAQALSERAESALDMLGELAL